MDSLINLYQQRLNLQDATFSLIDHEDAMVATVYRVTQPDSTQLIIKICRRSNDYLREVYFLNHFVDTLPVPRIIAVVPPEKDVSGAILMECLPGTLIKMREFTDTLAREMGSLLARIHLNRVTGYGDLIYPHELNPDPRIYFTFKFEEGLAECNRHLPKALIEKCRHYYDKNLNLLTSADGPCMIHRDFRAGNVIIYEGKIKGIIDWSSARASFAEEDFCPLEHGEWPSHPSSKNSFLAGYATIRPIPDYSAMMPLLRLSRAIAIIGFTLKCNTWESNHTRLYKINRQFLDDFSRSL